MRDEDRQHDAMQNLSEAIIRAIVGSDEVKGLVMNLLKQGKLCPEDVFALALKFPTVGVMEAKMGQLKRDQAPSEETQQVPPSEPLTGQFIDGRKLSPSEEAFEEYCAERFDVEAWQKRARVRLE